MTPAVTFNIRVSFWPGRARSVRTRVEVQEPGCGHVPAEWALHRPVLGDALGGHDSNSSAPAEQRRGDVSVGLLVNGVWKP